MGLQILTHPGLQPIDWRPHPARDARVSSNVIAGNGVRFTGSFYVLTNFQFLQTKAPKQLGYQLYIMQPPYSDGSLSAGTHNLDYALDIRPDRGFNSIEEGFKLQNWLRRKGWWCWFRYTGTWAAKSNWHIHGGPLPPDGHNFPTKVGEYVDGGLSQWGRIITSSQLMDYWNHSFGLKGQHASGLDNHKLSKYPRDIKSTIWDYKGYVKEKQEELAA